MQQQGPGPGTRGTGRDGGRTAPRLYLDNAATSFPKPAAVTEAMVRFAGEVGASPGRGSYAESRAAGGILRTCRQRINRLIGGESPDHVVFALNTSDALNVAIKGVVWKAAKQRSSKAANGRGQGGRGVNGRVHLVTTWMDHNSVLRPFNALREFWGDFERGGLIDVTWARADPATGIVDPAEVAAAIRDDTALVAVVHTSNVTGSIQPVGEIGRLCRERARGAGAGGPLLLVDAAQSLGHVPIDVQAMEIDLLAFPGHKGLLGPLGTGGLYIRPGVEERMVTLREGGTGSASERDVQPGWMPDRFEPGSHNTIGIAGLSEGAAWLLGRGIGGPDGVRAHEEGLMRAFLSVLTPEALDRAGLRLLGTREIDRRVGVFAFTHESIDAERFAERLEHEHGVLVRAGLHCAPLAHRTFGTDPETARESAAPHGAFRLSFGPFNTEADAERAARAVLAVARTEARSRSPFFSGHTLASP